MIADEQLPDWLRGYANAHELDHERMLLLLRCAERLGRLDKDAEDKARCKRLGLQKLQSAINYLENA